MLSKKNSIIVGCLFAVTLMTAQTYPAAYPQTEISNGMLRAKVYLPDREKGFYRGMRFDWAGVMASLEYKGHGYFGPFFEKFDPVVSDVEIGNPVVAGIASVPSGPVGEFLGADASVLGYAAPKPTKTLDPLAEVRGKPLVFPKDLKGKDTFYGEFQGFGKTARDYKIRVENKSTGAGVVVTCDQPLANLGVWAVRTVVAPEPY